MDESQANDADPFREHALADDPELIALPPPPTGRRYATLFLMAVVVVLATGLATSLRHEVAYFFSNDRAVDLGDVADLDIAQLSPDTFVRIEGLPTLATSANYTRSLTGETFVVFPLAGQRTVYVHMSESSARAGRTEFAGRLVTFGRLGRRMDTVQRYLRDSMGQPASPESYVLMVDETPGSQFWALALVALCALVVLFDVVLVLRWFLPLPRRLGARSGAAAWDIT